MNLILIDNFPPINILRDGQHQGTFNAGDLDHVIQQRQDEVQRL